MGCDCDKARLAIRQLASAAKMNRGSGVHAVHLQVFRGLARAHRSGALAALADGGGLGGLEPGAWFPSRADTDAETEAFDARLNAWLLDYASAANRLPTALVQQVDSFVVRWRDLRATYYFLPKIRADEVLDAEAEWNRLRDQVTSYGATSAITPATVTVDGREVRADQIPAGSSTIDKVERIAKWGAIIVGGAAAIKVASDLGVFSKVRKLAGA